MKGMRAAVGLSWMLLACMAGPAGAQTLPSEPISMADGRVTLGGDVTATIGSRDVGFFNFTDYAHSALRMTRIDISAAVKAGPHFTFLGEVRSENFGQVRPYALYVRVRPWTTREFDIQVGRVPPTFGAFARRTYAGDNPLIGYPLGYQYMTTMRADALAADVDELLRRRSLGWLFSYSVGEKAAGGGLALVSAFRWDTGVQVHATAGMLNATAAVTAGTVSNPLFHDDNSGRQVAGRVELRPVAGLVAGASLARGPFLGRAAVRSADIVRASDGLLRNRPVFQPPQPPPQPPEPCVIVPIGQADASGGGSLIDGHEKEFTQTAWGADLEYSRAHYLIRLETIGSAWRLPAVCAPALPRSLGAVSTAIESRYKLRPRLYVASRFDYLGFSEVTGAKGTLPWDAPVKRIEIGAGYSIQRNLLLKISHQYNWRDGGVLRRAAHLPAAQLVFWF
jgi:hypothetical protein